jgi:hypothetical protein
MREDLICIVGADRYSKKPSGSASVTSEIHRCCDHRQDYNNAHYLTRMLQTRQMAYSAVVRAIVNELEQVGERSECAHEVPMEVVRRAYFRGFTTD